MMIFKICSLTTRAASLSLYNHFAEICTSPKTTQKLVERDSTDAIEKIARLLIIENSGNTDELLKEAEAVIKHSKDMNTRIMAQIVVRKHLLYNKKLSFSKKQQLVDRIFGKSARKTLLSPSRTLWGAAVLVLPQLGRFRFGDFDPTTETIYRHVISPRWRRLLYCMTTVSVLNLMG